MQGTQILQNYNLILTWILLGVVARILPHPPNVTPLLALSLLSGYLLNKKDSLFVVLATLLISDMVLGFINQHVFFGSWTLFTYSGFMLIALIGKKLKALPKLSLLICGCLASLSYWIWTNLGVWLLSGMYPLSISGIENCFILALPFLSNALIGDLFWLTVFIFLMQFIRQPSSSTTSKISLRNSYEKQNNRIF